MKRKHDSGFSNIFSVLCRPEHIERKEKYSWQRIAFQYHPREEGTQMGNVKNGKDAVASRKVKSWQEEEEEDGRGFITVFAIVRHWDLPYVTTHTNISNFFTIYFNIILPPAVGLPSLHAGFSTKIFKEFLIPAKYAPINSSLALSPKHHFVKHLMVCLAWPPVTLYLLVQIFFSVPLP